VEVSSYVTGRPVRDLTSRPMTKARARCASTGASQWSDERKSSQTGDARRRHQRLRGLMLLKLDGSARGEMAVRLPHPTSASPSCGARHAAKQHCRRSDRRPCRRPTPTGGIAASRAAPECKPCETRTIGIESEWAGTRSPRQGRSKCARSSKAPVVHCG
jgi:hypothetical protein